MKSLKDRLTDWTDFDFAAWHLGLSLGVFTDDSKLWSGRKDIFWTNNLLGDVLMDVLHKLVHIGVLELDDEGRFRWNPTFKLPERTNRLRFAFDEKSAVTLKLVID